jgi:hypothetical protein
MSLLPQYSSAIKVSGISFKNFPFKNIKIPATIFTLIKFATDSIKTFIYMRA